MKRQISSYKGKKLCLWQKLLLSAVLAGAVTLPGCSARCSTAPTTISRGTPGRWWCWAAR